MACTFYFCKVMACAFYLRQAMACNFYFCQGMVRTSYFCQAKTTNKQNCSSEYGVLKSAMQYSGYSINRLKDLIRRSSALISKTISGIKGERRVQRDRGGGRGEKGEGDGGGEPGRKYEREKKEDRGLFLCTLLSLLLLFSTRARTHARTHAHTHTHTGHPYPSELHANVGGISEELLPVQCIVLLPWFFNVRNP